MDDETKYILEERAAIYQFEAGMTKEQAEEMALSDYLRMLRSEAQA